MTSGMDALPAPEDRRSGIYSIAAQLQRLSYVINSTQVAVDTAANRCPEWVGEASEAYVSQLQSLGNKVRELAPRFGEAANQLNDWADALGTTITDDLPRLWDEWDEASRLCEQTIADINFEEMNAQGSPSAYPASHYGLQRQHAYTLRDEEHERIRFAYEAKIRFLDEAAADAARQLRSLQDHTVPPEAAAGSREALGASLFDDIPMIDGQAQWEHALSIADDIREGLTDTDLTDEELVAFHKKYAKLLNDPFYSRAVLDQVSAEELYQFAMRIAPGMPGSLIPHEEERSDLLAAVGTMLALATGGSNYSDDTSFSQESFDQVKAGLIGKSGRSYDQMLAHELQEIHKSGRKFISPQGSDYFDAHTDIEGYNLFSQLTGHAANRNPNLTLGAAFYTGYEGADGQRTPSVAEDILLWDRETGAGLKAASNDGRAAYDLLLGTDSALLDPMQSIFLLSDTPDSIEGLPEDSPQRVQERDRLNAIGDFLSEDTPFTVKVVEGSTTTDKNVSFARYLAGHRNQSFEGSFGFTDHGHAFGNMIADVTAPEKNPHLAEPQEQNFDSVKEFERAKAAWTRSQRTSEVASTVASSFIEGYQDGLNRNHGDSDKNQGQDIYGYSNADLRPWMGKVLAYRAEDLALATSQSSSAATTQIGNQTDGPLHRIFLAPGTIADIIGTNGILADLAFDEARAVLFDDPQYLAQHPGTPRPALDYLRQAALDGLTKDLAANISSPGSGTGTTLTRWAHILGMTHIEPTDAAQELRKVYAERNRRTAEGLELAFDLATFKIADKVPGSDKIIKALSEQLTNVTVPADPGVSVENQRLRESFQFRLDVDQAYRQALTTLKEIPPYPGETFSEVPSEIAGDGSVFKRFDQMTPQERQVFDEYLTNNPVFSDHLQRIEGIRKDALQGWKGSHDTN